VICALYDSVCLNYIDDFKYKQELASLLIFEMSDFFRKKRENMGCRGGSTGVATALKKLCLPRIITD